MLYFNIYFWKPSNKINKIKYSNKITVLSLAEMENSFKFSSLVCKNALFVNAFWIYTGVNKSEEVMVRVCSKL